MQRELPGRGTEFGGAIGYPSAELFEEVAYVAYHFHWPYSDLMNLDHLERRRWLQEIAKINERINRESVDENKSEYPEFS
jgi:hypothetical protein